MSETALAVVPPAALLAKTEGAQELMRRASDVAGVCREIVMRTAMELQGKKYVKVEGWQSIATAFGCSPSIREVIEEEKGIKAVAELRRHDGTVLATAEGYCGLDEPRWANQALYARRGMAQTRAIARVCRSVFAFVVVLIDGNLSTTPAEEIPSGGEFVEASFSPAPSAPVSAGGQHPASSSLRVPFGKSKGKTIAEVTDKDLEWLLNTFKKSVDANDPTYHAKNLEQLQAAQAEAQWRIMNATGKVVAPSEKSAKTSKAAPKQAEQTPLPMDDGEEIITPFSRFAALGRLHGISTAQVIERAKKECGKDKDWNLTDVEKVASSLQAVPVR